MILVTENPIDLNKIFASVEDRTAGGHAYFVGTIREENKISGIGYEHYPEMTLKQIEQVVAEACRRWPIKKIAVVHRVGWVPVGEAAVAIAVSSAHRRQAFEACEFVIDRIKEWVPIWKRGEDTCCRGDPAWSPSRDGQPHRAAPTKI